MKPLVVSVTRGDIRQGKRVSVSSCPIALAVSRSTGRAASVGPLSVVLYFGKTTRSRMVAHFHAPIEVTKFVNDFDGRKLVTPFTFSLTREVS
jgi:hypothetical protein